MPDLSTTYMGLELKNPIIAASSGITKSVEKIIDSEQAGVGAVVIKSVFEEMLAKEDFGISDTIYHTEAYDYMRAELEKQYGPRDYIDLIAQSKAQVKIPIIASINCLSAKWWTAYAKQFQDAGADAIELNIFKTATRLDETSAAIEQTYFDIIEAVKKEVTIPIALKIGVYFTALPHFAASLAHKGAAALVLFNRFTEPDININRLTLGTTFSFSTSHDIHRTLRWTALLAGQIGCDISATTGVKSAEDVIKLLLAGASTVQIASLLYQKGIDSVSDISNEIKSWMKANRFEKISDFQGRLSFKNAEMGEAYLRAQFMEKIRGVE